ncbi:MAG: DUF2231 domain-containing protein [Methyloprofundus sp.]|nr:DUF2231 domain-containing protein [Methyloprofundus sp.]
MIDLIFDVLPQIHGGGNHQGSGAVKGLEAFLSFIESLTTKNPTEIFAAFMPGISALDNIHPLLVHFPIVLFTLFFFADTLGGLLNKRHWRQFATPLLYLGTLTAIFTVIAGFQAAYSAPHNDATHAIMLRHQGFGIAVTVLALLLSLRRYFADETFLERKTYGYFSLSALLLLLLTLGADLGGFMVYQYGVAVAPVIRANTYLQQATPMQGHNHGSESAHQQGDAHSHGSNEAAHQHDENADGHSHGANEAAHQHGESADAHSHANDQPAHQHDETANAHSHGSNEAEHSHGVKEPVHQHSESAAAHSHTNNEPAHQHDEGASTHSHDSNEAKHTPQKQYKIDIAVPVEILYEQATPAHTHDHGGHGHSH